MPVQREYLSPNEIAELLGVSPFTIRRYIKLGELRAVKLLGGFRVHRDELQRFLKAHEVNPAEEELWPEEATTEKAEPASPSTLASTSKPQVIPPTATPPALAARRSSPAAPTRNGKKHSGRAKKKRGLNADG